MTIIIDLSCSLADPDMTDGSLQSRVADLPRNTILLLEDIDAAFNSRFAFFQTFFLVSLGGDLEQRNYTLQGGTHPPLPTKLAK